MRTVLSNRQVHSSPSKLTSHLLPLVCVALIPLGSVACNDGGSSCITSVCQEAPASTELGFIANTVANDSRKIVTANRKTNTHPACVWQKLSKSSEQPEGYRSDVYRWLDASKRLRTIVLTRNDARDPGNSNGGVLRQFRYFLPDGTERVITGTGMNNYNGWGYVINHIGDTAENSRDIPGYYRSVFVGDHHAIHEFTWILRPFGVDVKATVHWFIATGHDYPIYAITFDSSAAGSNGFPSDQTIDSRAPYGDMQFGGDGTNPYVDGIGWGDKYQFFTRDEPLTPMSRWDYRQPNVVPYVKMWINQPDAEMGSVQTLNFLQHNAGGTWFDNNWGHTSEDRVDFGGEFAGFNTDWMLPTSWNWPYQLNQYQMVDDTSPTQSKRLAWGLMYGAVGQIQYPGYGNENTYNGHPYQSYSVYSVIGRHSSDDVIRVVHQVEHKLTATLNVTVGEIVSEGPGGVGRTDSVTYARAGYNQIYSAFELRANKHNAFQLTLDTGGDAIDSPVFIVRGATEIPSKVRLDHEILVADRDYFASYDTASSTLWITVNSVWKGTRTLSAQSEHRHHHER